MGYLMNESLNFMERLLNTMMKQVIAVAENEVQMVEKVSNIVLTVELNGKTLLEVFCESVGRDFFKIEFIFSCFVTPDVSGSGRSANRFLG
jgi:hypothetical protein